MKPIHYARQNITKEDIKSVSNTLNSDFLTQGPKIQEFENDRYSRDDLGHQPSCNLRTLRPHNHAGGYAPGLHPHGNGQGTSRAKRGHPPRAQERAHPRNHGCWPLARRDHHWRCRAGAHLRYPWPREALYPSGAAAGLPHRSGHRHLGVRHRHCHESDGRYLLRPA